MAGSSQKFLKMTNLEQFDMERTDFPELDLSDSRT